MSNPKISVITVVYNGAEYIEQTIKSVRDQDYENKEHIIIDGGSTDGTQQIIKKYEEHISYWISEKDSGMYSAMNKGWKKATGDLIGILNADDYYLEDTLKTVEEAFTKSNADVVYGNWTKLRYIGGKQYFREETPYFEEMQRIMGVFHPATFVKTSVYHKLEGYKEKYKLASDYDFVLRIYNAGYQFEYVNKSFTVFRLTGVSNRDCTSFKETYQLLLENNSVYAPAMKKGIYRCYFKKIYKGIVQMIVSALGLQKKLDKHLIKKWS